MEKELLLKCLKVMTKDQKSKVKNLLKWEKEHRLTIKAKTKAQIKMAIMSLIKKNKDYRPQDIVVKFSKDNQPLVSQVLRSLVANQEVYVDSSWIVSLRKDNV